MKMSLSKNCGYVTCLCKVPSSILCLTHLTPLISWKSLRHQLQVINNPVRPVVKKIIYCPESSLLRCIGLSFLFSFSFLFIPQLRHLGSTQIIGLSSSLVCHKCVIACFSLPTSAPHSPRAKINSLWCLVKHFALCSFKHTMYLHACVHTLTHTPFISALQIIYSYSLSILLQNS